MKTKILLVAIAAVALASSIALNHHTAAKVRAGNSEPTRTFQVNGRIREIAAESKTLTVAHEEIPGYMPAMTMPLELRDASLLKGLHVGDEIHFELSVTEKDSWISHIDIIATATTEALPAPELASESTELQAGESVPDFTLTDENGKLVHLSDFRGQAIVLTFIYTRCPLPNFCPLMSKNFQALQERLAKAYPGKYHLLSISIDPKFDTPEILKCYGSLYQADERTWTFATGTEEQINTVASLFGLIHEPEGGIISHNLRTALIAPDGRLIHLWKSNVWTPYEVHRRIDESFSKAS